MKSRDLIMHHSRHATSLVRSFTSDASHHRDHRITVLARNSTIANTPTFVECCGDVRENTLTGSQ